MAMFRNRIFRLFSAIFEQEKNVNFTKYQYRLFWECGCNLPKNVLKKNIFHLERYIIYEIIYTLCLFQMQENVCV